MNLGNDGVKALAELGQNPHFRALLGALEARVNEMMSRALDAEPANRIDATAYVRGLRDVWIAFESGVTGVPQRAVRQPRGKPAGQLDMLEATLGA